MKKVQMELGTEGTYLDRKQTIWDKPIKENRTHGTRQGYPLSTLSFDVRFEVLVGARIKGTR